jgi:hypothetical protein
LRAEQPAAWDEADHVTQVKAASRADTALRYMNFVKGEAPRAAEADFTFADWDELAGMVDTARFVRVGRHGEAMDWMQTVALMHRNIASPKAYALKAVTEVGNRVFLELDEAITHRGKRMLFDSIYIFTFSDAGKITRLEFFMH